MKRVTPQTPFLNFLGYFFIKITQEVQEGEFEGEAPFKGFPLKDFLREE